jgi:molybdate transport system substrate-binding protein
MRIGSVAAVILMAGAGWILLSTQGAAPQTPELRVLSSNGVKAVLESVRAEAARTIRRPLAIDFDTTAALMKRIQAGETFDVVVLTSEGVDELIEANKLTASSRADLSRVGIGIGMRAGAPKPDISSAQALKKTLLAATSITYAEDGASTPYIEKMLGNLGIAGAIKSKTIRLQGSPRMMVAVANGQAELVLTLSSEILPAKGVEYLGPLPPEYQHYVGFAAAVGADSMNQDAARALIAFLKSPEVAAVFKAKGMEPR